MNDSNKYPNIKPIELKEEKNNRNENNIQQNKNENIKINNIYQKCINKGIKDILNCFIYFIFLSFIFLIFIFNYKHTKNAFDENKNILIKADKLCKTAINIMSKCLSINRRAKYCNNENKYLEHCYEEVHIFNQRCHMFISELELCYRKNNNNKNKCKDLENDLISCGTHFKYFNIKNFKIIDLFV